MRNSRHYLGIFAVLAAISISCKPAPRHQLTAKEKKQDLEWVYNQYEKHYAPIEYKENKHGFSYELLKEAYLTRAEQTRNNAEFYSLLHEFVSEFADAHNSGSVLDAGLPGRHEVAYLGFEGKRKGDVLVVTKLLPTIQDGSNFPIKVGMEVTEVDGTPIADYVRQNMTRLRNLGNEEANLTYLMNRIFTRSTLGIGIPAEDNVDVTVRQNGLVKTHTLRWAKQDLYEFNKEQKEAAAAKKAELEKAAATPAVQRMIGFLDVFLLGLDYLSGRTDVLASVYDNVIRQSPRYQFWDTFQFIDTLPTWGSDESARLIQQADLRIRGAQSQFLAASDSRARLEKERIIPSHANVVDPAAIYPWYHRLEKVDYVVQDGDKKVTETVKQRVAYLRLDTFSPATVSVDASGTTTEVDPAKQVQAMVKFMAQEEIHDLVIDLIGNGGGSLQLGLQLAQAFSAESLDMPKIRFKLSEEWINDFQRQSMNGKSPEEKEIAEDVYERLMAEFDQNPFGISSEFPVETLGPHLFQPNDALRVDSGKAPLKLNIILMVDEMCASMCDIFTAVMKDNGLATVIGMQTMGAGGNVVNSAPHSAPNSHFSLSRTESLIVRSTGGYLENQGVMPDVEVKVNESVLERYEPVRQEALKSLLQKYVAKPLTNEG